MKKEKSPILFTKLIEILKIENQDYDKLVNILKTKQKLIVQGDVELLQSTISEEARQTKICKEIEEERIEIVKKLARVYSSKNILMTLKEIINFAAPENSVKLTTLRYKLKRSLNNVTKLNGENSYLLNISLCHVKELINLYLYTRDKTSETYNINGYMNSTEAINNKMLNYQI